MKNKYRKSYNAIVCWKSVMPNTTVAIVSGKSD